MGHLDIDQGFDGFDLGGACDFESHAPAFSVTGTDDAQGVRLDTSPPFFFRAS